MENTHQAELALRFRVGMFTVMGVVLLGAITIFVNNKPFWWRKCEQVQISVKDASGLKPKSEVRSLGLQIGYLKSVELFEMHVKLSICVTAPVDILPATRAFIRGEGILGDKFVELKPVRYRRHDENEKGKESENLSKPASDSQKKEESAQLLKPSSFIGSGNLWTHMGGLAFLAMDGLEARAAGDDDKKSDKKTKEKKVVAAEDSITYAADGTREIPVGKGSQDIQKVVDEVENLVSEMSDFTSKLKESINPEELRNTVSMLNKALENASETLSPEGNLTTTAQRTLAKLEDAIEQLRDVMTRVNQGKGSIGRIVNDDVFADELERAVKNVNNLLDRANNWQIIVNLGFERLAGYNESRGAFRIELWPRKNKFYRLGMAVDPRGVFGQKTLTTTSGTTTNTTTQTYNDRYGFQFIFQIGLLAWRRLELSTGLIYNDGVVRVAGYLWPGEETFRLKLIADVYSRVFNNVPNSFPLDFRANIVAQPVSILYVRAGIDSINQVNNSLVWSIGAGISFDDEDIKLLAAFL